MKTHSATSMLVGEYALVVSEEGQLTLPDQFLSRLGREMVVTRGFEHNLLLCSKEEFQHLAGKLLETPILKPETRALRRRLFSAAAELLPDKAGQISLPAILREFASVEEKVILAGMYNYVEIWDAASWVPVIEAAAADTYADRWDVLGI